MCILQCAVGFDLKIAERHVAPSLLVSLLYLDFKVGRSMNFESDLTQVLDKVGSQFSVVRHSARPVRQRRRISQSKCDPVTVVMEDVVRKPLVEP